MNIFKCPHILAHRGLSSLAPENTLAAFKKAQQLGFDWLEFDVMLSKDLHPVIFHDETLNRTTNGKGLLAHKTFQQLQHYDAGAWFGNAFKGEKIPSLETVLDFMKTHHHLKAVVEIKPTTGRDVITAEKIVHTILHHWPEGLHRILFASFSVPSLIVIKKLLPKQPIGFGLHAWSENSIELIKALDCYSVHVNHIIFSSNRLAVLRQTGCHVLAYTVNHPKRYLQLKELGVDGFFSDNPDKL